MYTGKTFSERNFGKLKKCSKMHLSKYSKSNQDLMKDCQLAKLFDSPILHYFRSL